MLKIGLVTGEFPPMEGGVGAFTEALARALAAAGHQIHVITGRTARPKTEERRLRDLLEPVDVSFGLLHPVVRRWRWPALAQVVGIILRHDLDLINIQYQAAAYNMRSPAINFLPWRLSGLTRTAVTFHDLRVPYLFPKAGRLRRLAVDFMARRADGVIATNYADAQTLEQDPNVGPVRQIPIGSNIETYTPHHIELDEVREKFGLSSRDYLLGYFGFLHESKGADLLIQALARLDQQIHLVFIGGQTGSSDKANTGSFRDQIRQQITALGVGDRVHWTGFVSQQRVSTFLHATDLMVMPYRDGVSLRRGTLMATLAHGRPLLTTTPQVPTPELVHGENVWLATPGEADALATAVRRLLADPDLRRRLGEGAAQVADRFTWDKIAAETAVFFRELVEGNGDSSFRTS